MKARAVLIAVKQGFYATHVFNTIVVSLKRGLRLIF